MGKILVTGFTGNVGFEVAQKLLAKKAEFKVAVRNVEKAKAKFGSDFDYVPFDLNEPDTFAAALAGVDRVFLMFPPAVNTPNTMGLFLQKAKELNVQHITYLSVKDVQYMPFIPHYKNEKAIQKINVSFTFLRAGYFMQNLNMFLLDEIKENNRIYVPAGKGKTSFTDVRDIAEIAARSLVNPEEHRNKKYAITGNEAVDFDEVAEQISKVIHRRITYANPSAKEFQTYMIQKGLDRGFVKVVTGLHLGTKFGFAKGITDVYSKLTGQEPTSLNQYLTDYKQYWI